jgi:hypothetical protein
MLGTEFVSELASESAPRREHLKAMAKRVSCVCSSRVDHAGEFWLDATQKMLRRSVKRLGLFEFSIYTIDVEDDAFMASLCDCLLEVWGAPDETA